MGMHGNTSIYRLLGATTELLKEIAATCILPHHKSLATSFADDFDAEAIRPPRPNSNKSTEVRGLRYAPALLDSGDGNIEKLFAAVRAAFTFARWTEFYEETPWSQPFLSRFATGECIGPTGRFQSDDIVLGLFVLGPETFYPAHAHAAEEFYIVIAGEADFQTGATSAFAAKKQGDVVFHESDVSHAIRTTSQPMLAVYGWRGKLDGASWFRSNMADETEPKKFPARM
jgi:quercetin dioxygenase-like cupin family protein